jgi:N-acetylmuramoyl-L-alanine amidase
MSDFLSAELKAHLGAMSDPQVVALVLFGEARSEPLEGLVAVGTVIRNRVNAKSWFGEDYRGVCLKAWQFSCLSEAGGASNYKRLLKLAKRLATKELIADPKEKQCVWVAHGIVGDYAQDVIKGAPVTHYHTIQMVPRPKWAQGVTPTKQLGNHLFYAGVK